ncbi:MAG: glutamate--cysteine ligase, partial [Phycisphaerae bacterium]|nr:glutamate--cysteine ligase [Phycisphaerae bacterium]
HGWSNLQSLHINLPFANDEEFGRLHAAIRLILPILPALAASSPIVDGRVTDVLDSRLEAYRDNCARIPCVSGRVIPEPLFSIGAYHERILAQIYAALRPFDPEGVLCHEWVNARGAIARFERNSIEIRVLDVQECPAADLAIASTVTTVLKQLVNDTWSDLAAQQAWSCEPLVKILDNTTRHAEAAMIGNRNYLRALGWPKPGGCTAGQLWRHLIDAAAAHDAETMAPHRAALNVILSQGTLARRILAAVGEPDAPQLRDRLHATYGELCACLATGRLFEPATACKPAM